ncbi:MAG: serine hydrolase [Oscillospiraceae bacterium]|nr:serine hydrolase [Oscillospiraceae bacterium]
MGLKIQLKTISFLYGLFKGDTKYCRSQSEKPLFAPADISGVFQEALPEQEGVQSEGLLKMFEEISDDRRINPHSALIIRHGKLISKADWAPFSAEYPHVSHSLAKSVTSMAAGIAIKEKYLGIDETLSDIFGHSDKPMRGATIRNLLTMSTGAKFNEAGSFISENWVESFLSSETLFKPGTDFRYNSMNTYMLSAAICKRTGLSLSEYLSRRLFTPMGINNFYWEKCPMGIEKGGWGLYMSIYGYAELGQLWLNGGIWNGVQLISRDWISAASAKQISHREFCSDGYGFQVWNGRHGTIFSGMFGQLVYIVPRLDMVIALTAGSENLFPCGNALRYIDDFLGNSHNFSSNPITRFRYAETASLRKAIASAQFGTPLETGTRKNIFARLRALFSRSNTSPESVLNGVGVSFGSNRADVVPLLIQIMDGCFGRGIDGVKFLHSEDSFFLKITMGELQTVIPISFEGTKKLILGGYNVASTAAFASDEDGYPVVKIQLCYLETSCTKVLKFVFTERGVTLKVRENPKLYSALDEISALTVNDIGDGMRRTLENILESDAAGYRIKSFVEPTLEGKYVL